MLAGDMPSWRCSVNRSSTPWAKFILGQTVQEARERIVAMVALDGPARLSAHDLLQTRGLEVAARGNPSQSYRSHRLSGVNQPAMPQGHMAAPERRFGFVVDHIRSDMTRGPGGVMGCGQGCVCDKGCCLLEE